MSFAFSMGCCCPGCTVLADDFNRADSGSLGTDWTQTAGTWTISSNTLRTSSSSAVAKCNTVHPNAVSSSVVTATLYGAAGDELRILVDYTDASNYSFAQLTIGSPNGCLALYKRASGTNTLLSKITVDTPATTANSVTVHFGNGQFAAVFGSASIIMHATGTGTYVGLGTGTIATEVRFDDFKFERHYTTDPADSSCPKLAETCSIASDNFNRADSTNVGCGWTEVAGDWSIASNVLTVASTAAKLKCEAAHPDSATACRVRCDMKGANGDKLRILMAYVDSSNYWYVEAKFGTGSQIAVGQVVAGTDTIKDTLSETITANVLTTIEACVADGKFTGRILGLILTTGCVAYGATVPTTLGNVGLATGGTLAGTAYFDNFTYERGHDANNPNCPSCCPGPCVACDTLTVPSAFRVTFSGVADLVAGGCRSCNAVFNLTEFYIPNLGCVARAEQVTNPCGQTTRSIQVTMNGSGFSTFINYVILVEDFDPVFCPGNHRASITTASGDRDCSITRTFPAGSFGSSVCSSCDFTNATCTIVPVY